MRLNEARIYAYSKQICLEHGNDLATFFSLFID